eukprot:10054382-Alexandrium_andersonii.AAC.1
MATGNLGITRSRPAPASTFKAQLDKMSATSLPGCRFDGGEPTRDQYRSESCVLDRALVSKPTAMIP